MLFVSLFASACSGERTRNDAEPFREETVKQLLGLANYLYANGDRATSVAVYRRIVDDDRATGAVLMDVSKKLEAANALDSAAAGYERVTQLDESNVDAFQSLGRVLLRSGRLEDTVVAFQRWIYLDSKNPEAYLRLAAAFDFAGRHGEAEAVYQSGLNELDEENSDISMNYALSLALSGRFDLAVTRAVRTLRDGDIDRRHLQNAVLILALAGETLEARNQGRPLGTFEIDLILRQANRLNDLESSADRARSLGGFPAIPRRASTG